MLALYWLSWKAALAIVVLAGLIIVLALVQEAFDERDRP